MNFLDLYKKIRTLDEGGSVVNEGMSQGNIMPQAISAPPSQPVSECGMGDGGMSPEPPKQQDSVSMSVNMNANGVGGIRDLMNVLQNLEKTIDSPEKDIVIGKGSEEPPEIDISALEEPAMPELPSSEPTDMAVTSADDAIMGEEGDEEETNYANDPEVRKMSVAAVMATGGDIHSKGKEAPKQAGGGNPWNVNESAIAAKLAKHYEEVKSRNNVTEGYWGWDPPDDDPEIDAYGIERDIEEVEIDLPQELHSTFPTNLFSFTYEFDHNGDLELHKILTYSEESDDMVDVTKYKDVLKNPIWSWIEKNDLDNYEQDYIAYHSDDGYRGDTSYDQRAAAQDAQNRWERGRDSRY